MHLCILFVQYDQSRYPHSFKNAQTLLVHSKIKNLFWIQLDNFEESQQLEYKSPNHIVVGGDNSLHEFSAWSKGIKIAQDIKPDAYLLMTDAFMAYGDSYQNLLNPEVIEWLIRQNSVAGLIDTTENERLFVLQEWSFWYWIRTSFVLIPAQVIKQIQDLATFSNTHDFCPDVFAEDQIFLDDAPMSQNYQHDLRQWLTKDWHSAFELCPETWQKFQTKLRSILNEHALSCRLASAGISCYDLRALQKLSSLNVSPATFDVKKQLQLCRPSFWKRVKRKIASKLKPFKD